MDRVILFKEYFKCNKHKNIVGTYEYETDNSASKIV